jgi:serine/threonine protein kinase
MLVEVNVLCKLRHPNIVPILAVTFESPLCVVYPLMHSDLQQHLLSVDKRQALSSSMRVTIMADVATGLAYLHEQV